ncbi:hypothetical protein AX774_g6720 [Zancudomyces culisetae]|uniref:Uncharacterized protein n=1 Tax=Zancudomyces culisetae TaxID=1213189 RepID=A0A1R1PFR8_ZANCU|nr:hypothetical protein AX774_g6720 [Zancudomyces culisetae]|eukprot:OMH79855.1 hypothetical protein AX774_g6720 [Zancudomyces culisetae]
MEELRTRLNNWLLDLENLTVHCGFEEYWNRVIDKEEWVYFIDIKLENLGKKRVHKHIAKVMKEAAGKWANNRSQLENSSHTTAGQNSRSGKSSGNVEGSSKGSSSSGSSSGSSGNSKVKKLNLEADGQKGIKEMEILGRYIDQYIDDEMVFRFYERLGKQLEFIDIGNSDQGKKSSVKCMESEQKARFQDLSSI